MDFGTNRKRICNFLLVGTLVETGPILIAPFLRYGNLLEETAYFSNPSAPGPCSVWNFAVKLTTSHEATVWRKVA